MKIQTLTAFVTLSLAGALSGADSQLIGMAMPEAKFLAGMYPDRLPIAFQQFILPMFPTSAAGELQALLTVPVLDPTHDIHEILMASVDPSLNPGLILARGVFNVSAITDYLAGQGHTVSDYNGVPLISNADATLAIAFPDASLAIMGLPSDVTAAVDRIPTPSEPNAGLVAKANDLSGVQDAWSASIFRPEMPSDASTKRRVTMAALAKVQQSTIAVKFGGTVQWTAQAQLDTVQDCTELASVVRYLASLGAAAGARPSRLPIAPLMAGVVIATKGTTLTLSLTIPAAQFQQAPAKAESKAARTRARRQ